MREIKFRAKREDTGAWVYGDLTHTSKINTKEEVEESGKHSQPVVRVAGYDVDVETIGEFTGLKDLDGREIYEHDILKCTDKDGKEHTKLVFFDDGAFCFRKPESCVFIPMSGQMWWGYSIIGNIHENMDLFINQTKRNNVND